MILLPTSKVRDLLGKQIKRGCLLTICQAARTHHLFACRALPFPFQV